MRQKKTKYQQRCDDEIDEVKNKEFDEKDQEVQMCMCDDTDLCNHKILKDKSRHEKTPLVTCKCNECGHHVTTCVGEYCTYSTNKDGGDVTQGCSNRSLPLIERKGIGACMSPAMSPSFVRTKLFCDCNFKHEAEFELRSIMK
uniref:Uncharacterized protein n=1 Tax=Romanomermis culicivorax TaxID=13658 RepID=A0A915I3L1_ROMCU